MLLSVSTNLLGELGAGTDRRALPVEDIDGNRDAYGKTSKDSRGVSEVFGCFANIGVHYVKVSIRVDGQQDSIKDLRGVA